MCLCISNILLQILYYNMLYFMFFYLYWIKIKKSDKFMIVSCWRSTATNSATRSNASTDDWHICCWHWYCSYCSYCSSCKCELYETTGSQWQNLFTNLSNGWNNSTITSYLTSATFTIRFKGNTETNDSTQNSWKIDSATIHAWT